MAKKEKQVGGKMGFFDELELDLEEPLQVVPDIASSVTEASGDLIKDILGLGQTETPTKEQKFTSQGEINDFQKSKAQKEEEEKKKAESKLAQARTQIVAQEEIIYDQQQKIKAQREFTRLIGSSLSSDEKKALLHVSLDYAEEHIDNPYHMVNLRLKLKEKLEEDKKNQEAKQLQVTSRKKAPNTPGINLNKVAEGGQAQLSTTGGGGLG